MVNYIGITIGVILIVVGLISYFSSPHHSGETSSSLEPLTESAFRSAMWEITSVQTGILIAAISLLV